MNDWLDYDFTIGMPHMVPNRLSEVELLKWLGAFQWDSISHVLAKPSSQITNAQNDRLYASFINIELRFPDDRNIDSFDEGMKVWIRNRIRAYAMRFVEGIFVFHSQPIPPEVTGALSAKADLAALQCPWAYMTNAFVSRAGSNSKLKVSQPVGMEVAQIATANQLLAGIAEHQTVHATGNIEPLGEVTRSTRLAATESEIAYKLLVENDVNGAGLLYFARYIAIMNYGERRFLSEQLDRPVSSQLIECLATEHRRIYYFVNADPSDTVRIFVQAWLLPGSASAAPGKRRAVAKLLFRIDLYRGSDGVLMASTLVRKSISVLGHEKDLVNEVERLQKRLA